MKFLNERLKKENGTCKIYRFSGHSSDIIPRGYEPGGLKMFIFNRLFTLLGLL